jgi:hypothetical protein
MNDKDKKKGIIVTIGMILIVIFGFWVIWFELPVPEKITEIFTPEVEATPEPTPTPTPTNNTTVEEPWDVCDPRHNASWLYSHGCYGRGGGSGGSSDPQTPRGVNIMVDGEEPWNGIYSMNLSGMYPGALRYIEVPVENIGLETARLWIRTVVTNESGGDNRYANVASSEPEYTECGGFEVGGYVEQCNISENVVYGVMVSPTDMIIDPNDGVLLSATNNTWIYLGQMSVGESVDVRQTYFMIGDTSNWAQGDIMTFDLEFYAVSLDGVDP